MNKAYNIVNLIMLIAVLMGLGSCNKREYSFGEITSPTNLKLETSILGVNAENPDGDGSGEVEITASANDAIAYRIDYGDGSTEMIQGGTFKHKFQTPGTNTYIVTLNAIGKAGVISTISKEIKVFVLFSIPTDILNAFTGPTGTKVWVTDREALGHFGVGPTTDFLPIWYQAGPNEREACAYDDEITFTKDELNRISISVDNKGSSFSLGASAPVYGASGADGCYTVNTGGTKVLNFMNATSSSTSSQSTRIQFVVPGNGIINFGTGGNTYEIISASDAQIFLRSIGSDGNAWYQKLKPKS
mgnify:CR=1 FL=1